MNNRQQSGRRRGRGGQRPQGGQGRPEQGNRIDNRARGNAAQLLEKYKSLARDAQTQGDRVMTEYYLQFADHYFRVLSESRARFEENQPRRSRDDAQDDYDSDDNRDDNDDGDDRSPQRQPERRPISQEPQARIDDDDDGDDRFDQVAFERPRSDRGQADRGQADRNRSDRNQADRGQSDRGQPNRGQANRERPERVQAERVQPERVQAERPQAEAAQDEQPREERRPRGLRPRRNGADLNGHAPEAEAAIDADRLPPSFGIRSEPEAEEPAAEAAPKPRRGRPRKTPIEESTPEG